MIQPTGTKTYKGNRVTLPGVESFEKSESILSKAGKFHKEGKELEYSKTDARKTNQPKPTPNQTRNKNKKAPEDEPPIS